jgi:hypothetical protein
VNLPYAHNVNLNHDFGLCNADVVYANKNSHNDYNEGDGMNSKNNSSVHTTMSSINKDGGNMCMCSSNNDNSDNDNNMDLYYITDYGNDML